MSKSDLQARPIYHRKRDFIEAHLTTVFAALAVTRWIEARTGWSTRKFVQLRPLSAAAFIALSTSAGSPSSSKAA